MLSSSEIKKQRRAEKEAALAGKILALPDARFGVIYADPPWRFEPYSRNTGMDRAPENHYATATTSLISSLGVDKIAAPDSVLFLWATVPMISDALCVMSHWGFTYKSQIVWVKDRIGLGYWTRNKHEILLIGTRGKIPAPAPGTQWASAIEAPVSRHSEKPQKFYDLIETYFPSLPKIELFARHAREGWTVWGAEAPSMEDETHDQ
jgi:N6-adenosine-specific RNA methylase IME4